MAKSAEEARKPLLDFYPTVNSIYAARRLLAPARGYSTCGKKQLSIWDAFGYPERRRAIILTRGVVSLVSLPLMYLLLCHPLYIEPSRHGMISDGDVQFAIFGGQRKLLKKSPPLWTARLRSYALPS